MTIKEAVPLDGRKVTYDKPGDVSLHKMVLNSFNGDKIVDLFPLYQAINIEEDIFNPTIIGSLLLRDSTDLYDFLPLIGEETLNFEWSIPGLEESFTKVTLRVDGVSKPANLKGNTVKAIVLKLISPLAFKDALTTVNRAIDAPPADSINNILTDDLQETNKKLKAGQEAHKVSGILPGWNPLRAIDFILRKSVSANPDDPSAYVFFEDVESFRMDTITHLITEALEGEPVELTFNLMTSEEELTGNLLTNIRDLSRGSALDTLGNIKIGAYKNIALQWDMINKTVDEDFSYDYKSDFKKNVSTKLQKNPLQTKEFLEETSNSDPLKMFFPKDISFDNEDVAAVSRYRVGFINLLESFTVMARLPGSSLVRIGDVVKLSLPKVTGFATEKFEEDDRYSGKYLVSAIKHEFFAFNYFMTLKLIRADSLRDLNEAVQVGLDA